MAGRTGGGNGAGDHGADLRSRQVTDDMSPPRPAAGCRRGEEGGADPVAVDAEARWQVDDIRLGPTPVL
jgi:hypothetical protein